MQYVHTGAKQSKGSEKSRDLPTVAIRAHTRNGICAIGSCLRSSGKDARETSGLRGERLRMGLAKDFPSHRNRVLLCSAGARVKLRLKLKCIFILSWLLWRDQRILLLFVVLSLLCCFICLFWSAVTVFAQGNYWLCFHISSIYSNRFVKTRSVYVRGLRVMALSKNHLKPNRRIFEWFNREEVR